MVTILRILWMAESFWNGKEIADGWVTFDCRDTLST